MRFPKDMVWGVATASYQIEGSPTRHGGGRSVWDVFCEKPGAIKDSSSGWLACDHYNRYLEDVHLMAALGIGAYRMSLSWPRLSPTGLVKEGINERGVDFYDRLIDLLLENRIDPWVTLFHWDYPNELYNRGGWLNPESSNYFADYAEFVVDHFSDRVTHWMTLNEPQCFIGLGLFQGDHAPGDRLQVSQVLQAGHNALLAHGKAVQVIRAKSKKANPKVGFAPVGVVNHPADPTNNDDVEAARSAMFAVHPDQPIWNNSWWTDPVYFGHYPEDGLIAFGNSTPKIKPGDMEVISQPLDFFGANIYVSTGIKTDKYGNPEVVPNALGNPRNMYDWSVQPESLRWGSKFFYERYKKPIVITENGMSCMDWVHCDGKVHDPQRIDFLSGYLSALSDAYQHDQIDLMGYFHWSLMDNFEWHHGYKQRFGLIHVDFETLKRTPKDSFYWYKEMIASNGADL